MTRRSYDAAEKAFEEYRLLHANWDSLERMETQDGLMAVVRFVFRVAYWRGWEDAKTKP